MKQSLQSPPPPPSAPRLPAPPALPMQLSRNFYVSLGRCPAVPRSTHTLRGRCRVIIKGSKYYKLIYFCWLDPVGIYVTTRLCRQRWTLWTAVAAGASTGSSCPADQTGPSSVQGHNMDIMCYVGIILALLSLSTHSDCYWRCCACIQFLK